jgi:hypothetical protein
MKRLFSGLLMISLMILHQATSVLAGYSPIAPQACPVLSVRITSVEVTPRQPAREHTIRVSWAAVAPECFTVRRVEIKGRLIFANGQARGFGQFVSVSQNTLLIQVPGLLLSAPVKVEVAVAAEAGAPVAGDSSPTASCTECDYVSPAPSCLPPVQVTDVQAVFAGLVVSPENPSGTHFPKVKVSWRVADLPSCYKIGSFRVSALIRATGGTRTKAATVSGSQTATEIVFDNFPVPSDFQPGLILASVAASGTATITGSDRKEVPLN